MASKSPLDLLCDNDSDLEALADASDSESWEESSGAETDTASECEEVDMSEVRTWCPIACDSEHPAPPRFPFTGSPGMKVDVECDNPLAYLKLFLTQEIIEKIVLETNRYQEQESSSVQARFSRSRFWRPVSSEEMWQFLGLIILQGLVGKPVQRWYWTKNRMLATPFFGSVMSEYRFSLIMRNLHFLNNEEYDEETHPAPKLKKIWEVWQMVVANFQRTYVPARDVSVDESLMAYKGRLSWIQYIASKRARFGVKTYMLCESSTGYIWNCIIYTGKGTKFDPKYAAYGMATASVLTLMEPLLDQGYCVTTDNFYSSPELYEVLIKRKTDAYGTVRPNRKNMPTTFSKRKLKVGEVMAFQKGKMMALRWRDKKDVCLLSTVHNTSTATVTTKTGKVVQKPQVVLDYNATMGGVDRADQAMTFYPAMRKQQRKYYKKIFRHLLEQCLWNSYVLYRAHSDKPVVHSEFVWRVAEQIFATTELPSTSTSVCRGDAPNPLRLTGRHFCRHIPVTGKRAKPTRICVVCCSKRDSKGKKVRKETRFYCADCDVGLCVDPCFITYHTQEDY